MTNALAKPMQSRYVATVRHTSKVAAQFHGPLAVRGDCVSGLSLVLGASVDYFVLVGGHQNAGQSRINDFENIFVSNSFSLACWRTVVCGIDVGTD